MAISPSPLSKREFRWASQLEASARYAYAVNKIREQGLLWCLGFGTEWALGSDPDMDPVLPVWPHPQFALEQAADDWAHAFADAIPLARWLDVTTPMLESEMVAVGVFMAGGRWIHVRPTMLADHLRGMPHKRYKLPTTKVWPPSGAVHPGLKWPP